MKILQINTFESFGGAAIAALRLHQSLCSNGIESKFITLLKTRNNENVISANRLVNKYTFPLLSVINKSPLLQYRNAPRPYQISPGWLSLAGKKILKTIRDWNPDIIHFHWVAEGMININDIVKISDIKPTVWTLHDMWALTGGCHYSSGCSRYEAGCGACPFLKSNNSNDITSRIFNQKKITWKNQNLTLISPSQWLNAMASKSPLFAKNLCTVIPNAVEMHTVSFTKEEICERYHIQKNKKIILAVSHNLSDKRKGFDLFLKSLKHLNPKENYELITMGNLHRQPSSSIRHLGYISQPNEALSIYAAADVFVLPSIEDNFPNTILESMSVGTPVVAFKNSGGAAEIIDHKINGYLAESFSPENLAHGISWVLHHDSYNTIRRAAKEKITHNYTLDHMAARYISLYQKILDEGRGRC